MRLRPLLLAALLVTLVGLPAIAVGAPGGPSGESEEGNTEPGLLHRGPSPLAPSTLAEAAEEFADHAATVGASLGRLATREAPGEQAGIAAYWFLGGGLALGLLAGVAVRRSTRGATGRIAASRLRERWKAPAVGALTALHNRAWSLTLPAALLITLEALHARSSLAGTLAVAALLLFALYRLAVGLFPILGRPLDPAGLERRLQRPPVRHLWRAARGLLALTLLGGFLFRLDHQLPLGEPLRAGGQFLFSLAVLALLWRLRDRQAWWHIAGGETASPGRRLVLATGRGALAVAALVPAVAAGLGYHDLSTFILLNLLLTVVLALVAGTVAAGLARGLRRLEAAAPREPLAGVVSARHITRTSHALALLVQGAILLTGFVVVLGLWGAPLGAIWSGVAPLLFGFEVGGHRISLVALIAAVVVLVVAFQAGRWARRRLRDGLLPKFTEDAGLRNSIASLGYYVVLVLGVLIAIAVAGFDLTNLAIIAGALSVGIGFGLQNVVNNFVSGLILLFERPIKVGDVIDYQGNWATVEEIKVRSTHVRTFDHADLIVPNSELVSSTVTNWSHSSDVARVILNVHVAYGSDTARVHDLLMQAATEHPDIATDPAPTVLFRDFGDSALEFQLRCFTHLDYYLSAPSELRFRIDALFREEGITIPFPQRDVHLHETSPDADPA